MGRKSDAKERLLAAGAQLLAQRPYSSIGVAEICAAAGVPKGSFYYFFASKQDLALAVVDAHWEHQRTVWAGILGGSGPVADRLRELFRVSAEIQHAALADSGVVAGCLFGNLALELSSTEATVRARLQEIFDVQVRMIEDTLAGDDPAGERDESLHHLATSLVAQLEGLVLFAKLRGDPSELAAHWDTIARMLPPTPTGADRLSRPSPAARTRPTSAADATAG